MSVYNGSIDVRSEIFVQVGVSKTDMFLWMVDKNVSRTEPLVDQRHIIERIDDIVYQVRANIINHAHGLEALSSDSAEWLSAYWSDIQSLR